MNAGGDTGGGAATAGKPIVRRWNEAFYRCCQKRSTRTHKPVLIPAVSRWLGKEIAIEGERNHDAVRFGKFVAFGRI